ncbi:MAG: HD domain-containing protein [Deltaproteobacteria bacterium]|jgi:putative nucleotidyltransferase with HDIG domain|nr:HD domain-containing protein [Deltaproteobacteria bacterium]MDH4006761.1 HD domain-containing protein [Desulfuromonadales bacterium]
MNVDEIKKFVQVLTAAVKGLRLYAVDHPATTKHVETLQDGLFTMLQHKKMIKMGLLEGTLFVEDHLIMQEFQAATELIEMLESRELAGFEFMAGLSANEIHSLLHLLHSGSNKGQDFADALVSQGVKKIRAIAAAEDDEDEAQQPRKVYHKALKVVDQIFQDVRMGEIPSSEDAIKVVKDMAHLTMTEPHAMLALSMLKDYDNYTFTHSVNVSVLALAIGRACQLTEEQLKTLGLGGLLHDLGKLRVDVNIITKPGRLTDSEFDEIKEHPGYGAEIIKEMEGVTDEVMQIVHGHHLRYDRTGYPSNVPGEVISPLVEMTAIADAYDAMTTLRSYQRPFTPRKAIARLKDVRGSSLHPDYVTHFIESLGPYPVGSLVRLDNNEIGLVVKVEPKDTSLVDIKIIYDSAGAMLDDLYTIQLRPDQPRKIIAEVDPQTKGIDVTNFFDLG